MPDQNPKPAHLAIFPPPTKTFAAVAQLLDADRTLSSTRKRDLKSALSRIAAVVNMPLAEVAAEPRSLNLRLSKIAPASLGISPKTWGNIVSNALAALMQVGIVDRRVWGGPLAPTWARLARSLADSKSLLRPLSRFMRYCSRRGIAPHEVTDATVAEYVEAREQVLTRKRGDRALYYLRLSWNKAAQTIRGWPRVRLTVPDNRRVIAVPFEELPASFQKDVERYLSLMRGSNPLAENAPPRPLAPATLHHRRLLLGRFMGYLKVAGIEPASIADLRGMA